MPKSQVSSVSWKGGIETSESAFLHKNNENVCKNCQNKPLPNSELTKGLISGWGAFAQEKKGEISVRMGIVVAF